MSDKIKPNNIISKMFGVWRDAQSSAILNSTLLSLGVMGLIDSTQVKFHDAIFKPKDMLERMSSDSVGSYDRVSDPFVGEKEPTLRELATGARKYSKLTSWGQTHAKSIEKITKAVDYLKNWKTVGGEAKFAGIENLKFLKVENLQMLDSKQINSVLDFLSEIYATTQKYDALRPDRVKEGKSSIESANRVDQKKAFLGSFDTYTSILEKVDTQISKVDDIKHFGIDAYADSLYRLGKDLNATEQMDAEVVSALDFIGISLKKDENDKWVVDHEATKLNKNGIELVDDKGDPYYFKLGYENPTDPIPSFLENYLNKKPNERNGLVITGQGIFELYKRAASPEMGIIDKLKNIKNIGEFKQKSEQYAKTYSLDGAEWKLFSMTRREKVIDNATKLALATVYMNMCVVSTDDILDQDMSDALRLNQYTKGGLVWRRVNRLCDTATYFKNLANEQISSDISKDTFLNILMTNDEYETQLNNFEEILKNRALTPEEEKAYEDLQTAKQTLQFVRNFEVTAINKIFESSLNNENRDNEQLKNDILGFVAEFGNCEFLSVTREGSEFKLIFDQSKLPDGLKTYSAQFEEIAKDINSKQSSQNQAKPQTNPTQTGTTNTSGINFDIKLPYLQDIEAFNLLMRSDKVDVVTPLETAEILERCKYLLNNGQENELTQMRDVLRAKFPGKKMTEIFEICKSSVQDPAKAQQLANDGIDIALFNSMFDGTPSSWCLTPEIFAMVCDNDLDAMKAIQNEKNLVLDSIIETNSRVNDRLKSQANPENISDDIKQALAEGLYSDVYSNFSKNSDGQKINDIKRQRADELGHEYHNSSTLNTVDKIKKNNETTKCAQQFTNSQMAKDAAEEESQKQQEGQNEVKYEERRTTFGDKNKKFDMEALNKKLKPYAKDWITKWLENLIKMIDKIEIVERVPIDNGFVSTPPTTPTEQTSEPAPAQQEPQEGSGEPEKSEEQENAESAEDKSETPISPENSDPAKSETASEEEKDKLDESKTDEETPQESDEQTSDTSAQDDQEIDLDNMEKLDINSRRIAALRVLSSGLMSITDKNSANYDCLSDENKSQLRALSKVFDTLSVEPNSSQEADYQETLLTLLCKKAVSGESEKIDAKIEEVMALPELLGSNISYDENGNVSNEFSDVIKNFTSIKGKTITDVNRYSLANVLMTVTNYSTSPDGSIKFDLGDKLTDDMIADIANCNSKEDLLHLINSDNRFESIRHDLSRLAVTTSVAVAQVETSTNKEDRSANVQLQYEDNGRIDYVSDDPTMG